jgi:hypothetical protein
VTDVATSKRRRKDTADHFLIFVLNQLLEKTTVGSVGLICLIPFHWLTPIVIPMNLFT